MDPVAIAWNEWRGPAYTGTIRHIVLMVTYTIMRTAEFNARELEILLERKRVCTFSELAEALGTESSWRALAKSALLCSAKAAQAGYRIPRRISGLSD